MPNRIESLKKFEEKRENTIGINQIRLQISYICAEQ